MTSLQTILLGFEIIAVASAATIIKFVAFHLLRVVEITFESKATISSGHWHRTQ